MSEKLTGGLKGNFSRFLPDSGLVLEGGNISGTNLFDLQVNGVSRFKVDKTGIVNVLQSINILNDTGQVFIGINGVGLRTSGALLATTGPFGIGSTDTSLSRKAAASLQLGAADAATPVAQTLSVQSVAAGTANTAGANWTFTGSQGTGTGAGGSIIFQVAPAGSTGSAQNTLVAGLQILPSTAQYAIAEHQGVTVSRYFVTPRGYFSGDSGRQGLFLGSSNLLGWCSVGVPVPGDGPDLYLARDAAGVLAQRDGVNSQTFRLYETYTDASNYGRFSISQSGAYWVLGGEAAGTGSARNLRISAGGGQGIYFNCNALQRWAMLSAGHLYASDDNSYDIGASGANRPRNLYVANNIFAGGTKFIFTSGDGYISRQDGFGGLFFDSSNIVRVNSSSSFQIDSRLQFSTDVVLIRDAANILAQRNGVNAQTFRLYNTYTDASNYERGVFDWSTTSNVLRIGTEAAGTGTLRSIALVGGNVGIGTTSPFGHSKLVIAETVAGTNVRSTIYHGDNTNGASHAIMQIQTGGASSGDPHIWFGVSGVSTGWALGLDNSDSDKFKISGPYGDVGGLGTNDRFTIDASGNVGIGTSTPGYKLEVNGSFAATTKSFVIDHPTKPNMKLRYGSLESPYHGVRLTGESVIEGKTCRVNLPDYINGLCKQEGSQVQITNIRHGKVLWVDTIDIDNNYFEVSYDYDLNDDKKYSFYWSFTGIRKDIEDMIVEF